MADIILTDETPKKLPFSLEAEQSVLGSIIIDPEKFRETANVLNDDDFYLDEHKSIYAAMKRLFIANSTIDAITLVNELIKSGTYDDAGGKNYVALLANSVPSIHNLPDYIKIIKDKALLRRLIEASSKISEMAYSEEGETAVILDRAEQLIFDIAEKNETKGFVHIQDVTISIYNNLNDIIQNGKDAMGTPTGFRDIDKLLIGMGKGDFIVVGARPGMGKTSFCLNIASQVALQTKKTVAIFSLEMSAEQLVTRMLSSEAFIDSYKMRKGELSEAEWTRLADAAGVLSRTDILIDDTSGISVMGMKSKLRRIKNLGLVVVDYLQLMNSDNGKKDDNQVQKIADISRGLKLMAKEFGVPVVTCAQLSRGTESRTDKTPQLSDLRDSGAIEQDADIVLFLYRGSYYDDNPENQNKAVCSIAKNRHGEVGKVELGWLGQFTKFTTLDKTHE